MERPQHHDDLEDLEEGPVGELESPWSDSDDLPSTPIEATEFEEMLSETTDAEQPQGAAADSPPKDRGRRRRRRRRGGRKASEARSDTSPSNADEDNNDVSNHDDDDSLTMPEGLAEAGVSDAKPSSENGEKTADDAADRPRRRRRRRGGGKKKRSAREGAASEVVEAGAPSDSEAIGDELDEEQGSSSDLDEQDADNPDPRHRSADPDDDDGDDDDDSKGMKGHKGIPSWDEAVGCIIAVNMESRARNPHSSSSGPRGRGGRGGGGPHRGGRGRPAGS